MTDLPDGVAAVLLAGVLNAILVARVSSSQPPRDGAFVGRVYRATLLLRAALAIALNAFAANSAFAATFCGDSGAYDAGVAALARRWGGESAGTSLTQALSAYGFVYIVGALNGVPAPEPAAVGPEDPDLVCPDEGDALARA